MIPQAARTDQAKAICLAECGGAGMASDPVNILVNNAGMVARASIARRGSCVELAGRHNGAVKIKLSLVLPCLVACAAGAVSCSSQSGNPSSNAVDAAKDGRADSASLGGSDAGVPGLDAQDVDAPSAEASLQVDAGVDRAAIGGEPDVEAIDAGLVLDVAPANSDTPQTVLDSGVALDGDAGLDTAAKDAPAPEAGVPDATQTEASAPDTKVDGAAADVMVKDAKAEGPTSSPDAGADAVASCGRIKCDCTFNGKKLWGKVQYVDMFPDFKVSKSLFPDLNVTETMFPSKCGEWHTVDMFPDFTVQLVDMFEDFSIADSYFPGIPGQ
jgi:hypothetical protein